MSYGEFKEWLENWAHLPKWLVIVILDLIGPLAVLVGLRELLEPLDVEPPAAQLIPIILSISLYWFVLLHHLYGRPTLLLVATAGLLLCVCIAVFPLWRLHNTQASPSPVYLSVPLLVVAAALLIQIIAAEVNTLWRERIARYLGLVLLVGLMAVAISRPEDWYLIADTVFTEAIPRGQVGIFLAPYNNDTGNAARGRLREDLSQLVGQTPALASQVKIVPLRRPIPGYRPEKPTEQIEAAQRIGVYNGGYAVVYGAAVGANTSYLVKTRLVLINSPSFLKETLTVSQIDLGPPTNDARIVHLDAAMIAGSIAFVLGKCAEAERVFSEAAASQRQIVERPTGDKNATAAIEPRELQIGLYAAGTIICQIANGAAPATRAEEVFRSLDAIIADPASSSDVRLQAAIERGKLHRNLADIAFIKADPTAARQELESAIDSYIKLLAPPPSGSDPVLTASAWNGLGVARMELGRIGANDDAERRSMLASAVEAYDHADRLLNEPVSGDKAESPVDRQLSRAAIGVNRGTVLLRIGVMNKDPDKIADAVRLERSLLPELTGTSFEPTLHSNLGDALFALARYRDSVANLREAREELERSLAASPDAGPVVTGEVISKIGYTEIALAHAGSEPAAEQLGIASWACALRLFRSAGLTREANGVEDDLAGEKRYLGDARFDAALRVSAPFKPCQKIGTAGLNERS